MSGQRHAPRRRGRHSLEEAVTALAEYMRRHGPWSLTQQVRHRGINLTSAVTRLRAYFAAGKLTASIRKRLERIPGWTWNPVQDHIDRVLGILRDFVERYGWRALDSQTVHQGFELGYWVWNQRRRRVRGDRITYARQLEEIPGWSWEFDGRKHQEEKWVVRLLEKVARLARFAARKAPSRIAKGTLFEGIEIDREVRHLLSLQAANKLPPSVLQPLQELPGWPWRLLSAREVSDERYREHLAALHEFTKNRSLRELIPAAAASPDAQKLLYWIRRCRTYHHRQLLPKELAAELEKVPGWEWNPPRGGVNLEDHWWKRVHGTNRTLGGLIQACRRHASYLGRRRGEPQQKRYYSVPQIARRIDFPLQQLKRVIRREADMPPSVLQRLAADLHLPAAELQKVITTERPASGNLSGLLAGTRPRDQFEALEQKLVVIARSFVALLRAALEVIK